MPRYRFHFTDRKSVVPDDRGTDLRNDEAAVDAAYHIARDLRDAPPDEDCSDWTIDVTDEKGRLVTSIRAAHAEPSRST